MLFRFMTAVRAGLNKFWRFWRLTRTHLLWSRRFHSIGSGSTVGKCRLVANPKAISIGHHTTLSDDWCLVDLNPSVGESSPKIRIGSHCSILYGFHCNAGVSVELQDHVL